MANKLIGQILLVFTSVLFFSPSYSNGEPTGPPQSEVLSRPITSGPIVVKAAFYVQDINNIDDEGENFEFTGKLLLTWRDDRQAFDPKVEGVREKNYNGNYQVNELSPAWYPQVVLLNESGLFEKNATYLTVKPDGTCTLIETVNGIAEVDLSMRKYPFDTQQLEAKFEIFGLNKDEAIFEVVPESVTQSVDDIEISQWNIVSITTSVNDFISPYSGKIASSLLVLSVDVSRQSLFAIRLIVVPLVVIVVLSWSVFWMERSSLGDRINISFIGILTAVAYQIVVSDILPHISYVTFMNGFLNLSFVAMCATVVMNLIVGFYDKRGMTEIGDRIDIRCRWIFPLVYFGTTLIIFTIALLLF